MGEQERRGSGEQCTGGRGDRRGGGSEHFGRGHGRHVATDADQVIELIPQVQKEFFHARSLYGRGGRADVRALTLTLLTPRLAAASGRA